MSLAELSRMLSRCVPLLELWALLIRERGSVSTKTNSVMKASTTPVPKSIQKMPRQPAASAINAPSIGAVIGAMP